MRREHLSAFIFPSTDAHQSEYVADHWQGRTWISGFNGSGGGANRSVGWLKLGQVPASMTIAFGDASTDAKLTGAQSDLKEIVEKKRVEMSLDAANDVSADEAPAPAAPAVEAPAAEAAPAGQEAP